MQNTIQTQTEKNVAIIDDATTKVISKKIISKKEKTKKKKTKKEKKKKEEKKKEKDSFLYRFQLDNVKRSYNEEKQLRNKLRRKCINLMNSIITEKEKTESIKEFISFYKKEYVINDYSIESITSSSKEEIIDSIDRGLKFIKSFLEKK